MRYLILSDIHANWEALEAVLDHADGEYDKIACCGDIVGYGADPNATADWTRRNVTEIVRGNHDKACVGLLDPDWFNPVAKQSAEWSAASLTSDNADWLRALPKGPLGVDSFQLVHGSPVDEDEYLVGITDAAQVSGYLECRVSFFGHTHMQGGFLLRGRSVSVLPRPRPSVDHLPLPLDPDYTYLINPGAVGQPRDGDPRAAYAIYESESRLVTLRRTPYDVRVAQQKIRDAGLPPLLADRLTFGR